MQPDFPMRAADVMVSNVITVGVNASIGELAATLLNNHISGAPVVGEKGQLVGIVSEGDLIRRPEIGTTKRHRVHQIAFPQGGRCDDSRRHHCKTGYSAGRSDPKDLSATLALADEIDARGLEWRPSAPSFFRRTSNDVCKAIAALDDPRRTAILKRHLARIDDPALRRAFRAAVKLDEQTAPSQREPRKLVARPAALADICTLGESL
jgi:CBS domain-containing protein